MSTWLRAVLLVTGQDGAYQLPDQSIAELAAHCDAGVEAACLGGWVPLDREALATALPPLCDAGDAVSCLVVGWHLSQPEWGVFDAEEAHDAKGAAGRFSQACALGLTRGCTEVAHTLRYGLGTYPSPRKASELATSLCEGGEPQACRTAAELARGETAQALLQRGVALGDSLSALQLARRTTDLERQHDLLATACSGGVPDACLEAARVLRDPQPDEASALLARGCELGDPLLCTALDLWQTERGTLDAATATSRLEAACADGLAEACEHAPMLARGAPAIAFREGRFPQIADRKRLINELRPGVHACYLDRLRRGPVEGTLSLAALVDADGRLLGAAALSAWVDDTLQDCIFAVATDLGRTRPPTGGALMLREDLVLGHSATVTFKPRSGLDAVEDITEVVDETATWGRDLDRCALQADGAVSDMELSLKVARTGEVKKASVATTSGSQTVDTCVVERALRGHSDRLVGAVAGTARVRFFEPAPPEAPEDAPARMVRAPWAGDPVPWRVLAVVVSDNQVDGKNATLSAASIASIREAHEGAADWVKEHTFGQVEMTVDLLTVDGPLEGALSDDDGGGRLSQWVVEPEDLPLSLLPQIEPLAYHSIYLWAPIPRGYPQPALGTAWGHTSLRGATFASSVLPSGRKVEANGALPAYYLVLHELWHQLEYRAERHLDVHIPDNHEVARLPDGRVLSPRDWRGADDAMDWYVWAFDEQMPPELWTDLLTWGRDTNQLAEGNLAYGAIPIASGDVAGRHQLTDGVLDFGEFWDAAERVDGVDAYATWFGMVFENPTEVRRVRAHLTDPIGAPTSVSSFVVEISTMRDKWIEVARVEDAQAISEVSFDPVTAQALRIRVLEAAPDQTPVCRELEAY